MHKFIFAFLFCLVSFPFLFAAPSSSSSSSPASRAIIRTCLLSDSSCLADEKNSPLRRFLTNIHGAKSYPAVEIVEDEEESINKCTVRFISEGGELVEEISLDAASREEPLANENELHGLMGKKGLIKLVDAAHKVNPHFVAPNIRAKQHHQQHPHQQHPGHAEL